MSFLFNLPLQKKGIICLCSLGQISLLSRISLKFYKFQQEKLELIVQKLTEIGIDEMFLWASERSVLKSLNPNKEQRLLKIIKEATEQSWSWMLPKLTFLSDIKPLHKNWQFVVFDLPNHKQKLQNKKSDLPLL